MLRAGVSLPPAPDSSPAATSSPLPGTCSPWPRPLLHQPAPAVGHNRDRDLPPGRQRLHTGCLGRPRRGLASAHLPGPAWLGALGSADRPRPDCHRYCRPDAVARRAATPGRTATTWLGLEDPAPTATTVAHWLTTRNVSYALSGDVAADLLAPCLPLALCCAVDSSHHQPTVTLARTCRTCRTCQDRPGALGSGRFCGSGSD